MSARTGDGDRFRPRCRADLTSAKRVIVKVGTSTVSRSDGSMSLGRIGNIVEQLSALRHQGKDVILVSSGAVGVGRSKLHRQHLFSRSVQAHLQLGGTNAPEPASLNACAAAGQSGMMGLYDQLFGQYDVLCAQVLVSPSDFAHANQVAQLKHTLTWLLEHNTIPVLNENDAISSHRTLTAAVGPDGQPVSPSTRPEPPFKDNDGLASLLAGVLGADVLVLLSDVEGVYRCLPEPGQPPDIIDVYTADTQISIGQKSSLGRGGMGAKIDAALRAAESGVGCVAIASGHAPNEVEKLFAGETVGTLFFPPSVRVVASAPRRGSATAAAAGAAAAAAAAVAPPLPSGGRAKPGAAGANGVSAAKTNGPAAPESSAQSSASAERASAVRAASRQLQRLSCAERSKLLHTIADELLRRADEIYAANALDIKAADDQKITGPLRGRLEVQGKKLKSVIDGIRALAGKDDPLGRVKARTRVADGLELLQETVAIGVLLIIFESRPDVLPQVSALAIVTGNGVLLKGGREAIMTNRKLHEIITDTVHTATGGAVDRAIVSLLETRTEVSGLLKLHHEIDLVIPRGGAALVQHVMQNSSIPVLGHADGICHAYVDRKVDLAKAKRVLADAKLDYPTACNAVETALVHVDLVEDGRATELAAALTSAGVRIVGGPRASKALGFEPAADLRTEYGDNTLCVEVVDDLSEAVAHIARYGSSHTEVVLTEDAAVASSFLSQVDSACVFHNASTRFADGFRFGLGCEVGISTSRIHARGPVGLEGLLTTRWRLVSTAEDGHTVSDFSSGRREYTHEQLAL